VLDLVFVEGFRPTDQSFQYRITVDRVRQVKLRDGGLDRSNDR